MKKEFGPDYASIADVNFKTKYGDGVGPRQLFRTIKEKPQKHPYLGPISNFSGAKRALFTFSKGNGAFLR